MTTLNKYMHYILSLMPMKLWKVRLKWHASTCTSSLNAPPPPPPKKKHRAYDPYTLHYNKKLLASKAKRLKWCKDVLKRIHKAFGQRGFWGGILPAAWCPYPSGLPQCTGPGNSKVNITSNCYNVIFSDFKRLFN